MISGRLRVCKSMTRKQAQKVNVIDLGTWDRTPLYTFFKRMDYPHTNISANVDISKFFAWTKESGLSFYYSMIFAATYALNEVEAFRYRIRGEQVVLHDTIHPAFTDMDKMSELFQMRVVNMERDIGRFVEAAGHKTAGRAGSSPAESVAGRDDLTFITCIPEISFTQINHTISLNPNDAIPRLAWGKYFEENGKLLLPFSVQANHAFVDGIHMGRYFTTLQDYLDDGYPHTYGQISHGI